MGCSKLRTQHDGESTDAAPAGAIWSVHAGACQGGSVFAAYGCEDGLVYTLETAVPRDPRVQHPTPTAVCGGYSYHSALFPDREHGASTGAEPLRQGTTSLRGVADWRSTAPKAPDDTCADRRRTSCCEDTQLMRQKMLDGSLKWALTCCRAVAVYLCGMHRSLLQQCA
jgi:hypothetical protein